MRQGDAYIDGLLQKRRVSSALAMELRLSCTDPSICINELGPPSDGLGLNRRRPANQCCGIVNWKRSSHGDKFRRNWNQSGECIKLAVILSLIRVIMNDHYNDVIMIAMAYQITSLTIVYSIVYSGTDKRKHQSSASLAFMRGIHRWPMNSPHKGPVPRKMFPFDDAIKHDHVRMIGKTPLMFIDQLLWVWEYYW